MPDSTKRILTDETGQDIVSALNNLIDAVDPTGSAEAANTAATAATNAAAAANTAANNITSNLLSLEGRKTNAENIYKYKEVSGSVVTIEDAAAEAVKQMRIEIAPMQDLHGYDNPWPGGGGKNLLNPQNIGGTSDFTFDRTNEIFTCVNATGAIVCSFVFKANTSYTLSSTIVSGTNKPCLIVRNKNGSNTGQKTNYANANNPVTFQFSEDTEWNIQIQSSSANASISAGDKFKIMLEVGTSASTWQPYSNICPISGWTGANVTRCGKNLCGELEQGTITDEGIKTGDTATRIRLKNNKIFVRAGQSYTIQYATKANKTLNISCKYWTKEDFSADTSSGATGWISTNPYTFTPSVDRYFAFVLKYSDESTMTVSDITVQVEKGSAATYEPYTGQVYEIDFPSEAGTVYGGTLTINQDGTGTIVVDRANVDLGTLTWIYNNGSFRAEITGFKRPTSTLVPFNGICSKYVVGNQSAQKPNSITGLNWLDAICFWTNDYTQGQEAQLKAAMSGVYLVYELATPVTYTLTPGQVKTLLGVNNIWADTGDILSLTYPTNNFYLKDEADTEFVSTDNLAWREATGNPITIDALKGVAKQVKVKIEPKQDLHGYGKPWPGGAGKNELPFSYEGTETKNGITLTAHNGVLTAIGTATADTVILFPLDKTYTIPTPENHKLCICNNGVSEAKLYFAYSNGSQIDAWRFSELNRIGESWTGMANMQCTSIGVSVANGLAVNLSFAPMFTLKTNTDDFEPYSNICPIIGYTETDVTVTGKNLCDGVSEGIYINTQYSFYGNSGLDSGLAIPTFGCSSMTVSTTQVQERYRVCCGNVKPSLNGVATGYNAINKYGTADTIVVNTTGYKYLIINATDLSKIQVEYGFEATTFEPYAGHVYPITFPGAAGTVYGGTVTVNDDGTGTLVLDRARVPLTQFDFSRISSPDDHIFRTDQVLSLTLPIKGTSDNTKTVGALTDRYSEMTWSALSMSENGKFAIAGDLSRMSIVDHNYSSVDDFVTANATTSFVYPLATPVTYTLTPPQIRTLLGVNHIYGDAGDITILYPYDSGREQYAQMIYETESAPAPMMTVTDGADGVPVKELVVAIEPVHAGSGDPSPSNVRAIIGWDGCEIVRTGGNLLNAVANPFTSASNVRVLNTDGIKVISGKTYTFRGTLGSGGDDKRIYFMVSDNPHTVQGGTLDSDQLETLTWNSSNGDVSYSAAITKSGYLYVVIGGTAGRTVANAVINEGSSASYEPYAGNTYPISFDKAGTVYGGTLTIDQSGSGTLVVDRKGVDLGDASWSYQSQNARFYTTFGDMKAVAQNVAANYLCSQYKFYSNDSAWNGSIDGSIWVSSHDVYISDHAYTDAATFKAAMAGVQLVYELVTPVTYHLQPGEVTTLLGLNNVWADTGNVKSLTYPADTKLYIDKKFAEIAALATT